MKNDVTIENQIAKFEIQLNKDELKPYIDKAIDKKLETIEEDGFRKGKFPKSSFLTKYGVESVYQDVIDEVLNENYPKIIEENNLDVVAQPELNFAELKIDEKEGFSVSGTVALFPEVNVSDYTKHKDEVTKENVEVSAEDVAQEIKGLLADKAIVEVSEDPAKDGDTVVIDFEGSIDGELFEGGAAENHELELGSNQFIPGFEEQLIGKKEGDEVEVKVSFPEDYHAEDLAGKEAVFKTTIHEVKTTTVPELTDEIAKEIEAYEAGSKDELEEKVKAALITQKEEQALNNYNYEVISKLIEAANITVPQAMIDREIDNGIESMKQNLAQQGIEFDLYLQIMGGDEKAIRDQMQPEAKRRIEEFLVIDAIVKAENYEVSDQEADEKVKELMEANNLSHDEVIEALGGDTERLKENIAYDKAYRLVLGE